MTSVDWQCADMEDRKVGESSDSEAYLSADEGLTSGRGSEKEPTAAGGLAKTEGPSSGKGEREGGKEEQERINENERPVANSSPAGCSSPSGLGEALRKECDGNYVMFTAVKRGQDGVMERGEGDEVKGGVRDEREKTPIPPPRRKRKKKLQKNPSLEDLEKASQDDDGVRMQRSLTVGSVDMSRERAAAARGPISPLPLPSSSPQQTHSDSSPKLPPSPQQTPMTTSSSTREAEVSPESGVRGGQISPPAPHGGSKSRPRHGTDDSQHDGRVGNHFSGGRPPVGKKPPSISIEPDTSLELTEDMMHGQTSEVMTRDTPLAKAYGSDIQQTEIIFDSDDESEGEGVYGSQELHIPDHSDSCPDGDLETRDSGQSSEVMRGGHESAEREEVRDQKEHTPVEEEDTPQHAPSPSDNQILQMTIVKNLDTGDSFPLSVVDEKIPLGNPLNQHLYHRTAAMESHADEGSGEEGHHRRKPHLKKKLRQFWGKKKAKPYSETLTRPREGEGQLRGHMTGVQDLDTAIKYKPSSHHKGPYDFDHVRLKQDLTGPHLGAVWVMEFSICGRLLAVAGQDSIVRVWVLRTAAQFFHELQAKYQRFGIHSSGESLAEKASVASTTSSEEDDANATKGPFLELPLCNYHGHSADILDLSWSKNFFLLSSSMDKTVRLWHISRKECLCCFQHVDFVTAIAFHPRDDRYFLSGSLDGKLRLWNIPDKRVALWNEIEGVGSHLITAANFCMNGKLAVAGTYDGRCIFYETEHLKYHTQIHVRSRHGKNRGRKVSGIEPLPGEDKILVTTNDSRLRMYNLKDHSLSCKYKGGLNTSSQIRATFSRDGLSIICGSEDHFIYVWKTHHDVNKLSSVRRDRNEFYESFSTHNAPVTAAVFAPVPGITVDQGLKEVGQMIVAADYQGGIKVYVNSEKL